MPVTASAERPLLVARQPIIDPAGVVRGHELLFRGPRGPDGAITDGHRATAQVLVATFLDIGIGEMAGSVPAWVNVSRELLLQVDPLPLPADRVVLELLEDARVDDRLITRLRELRAQGFEIALDDFVWTPERDGLVRLASFVKLDVRALGLDGFRAACARLRDRDVVVVAEKVETREERDACVAAGADLLQGWFFARPETVARGALSDSSLGGLQGAARFTKRLSFEEVEQAIVVDPGLSAGVLRLLHAASRAVPNRVGSVRQALVLLGADVVRQWALLVSLAGIAPAGGPLLASGLLRARLCELRAPAGAADPDSAFAVGLLSVLDAICEVPMAQVLEHLPLDEALCAALLHRAGPLGALLDEACAAEQGRSGDPEVVVAALRWTDGLLRELRATSAVAAA